MEETAIQMREIIPTDDSTAVTVTVTSPLLLTPTTLPTLPPGNKLSPTHLLSLKKDPSNLKELLKGNKKLHRFYQNQNDLIDELVQARAPSPSESSSSDTSSPLKKKRRIALYGSLLANILLSTLQLFATIFSGSIAICATMADAFMDLLSGGIILVANKLSKTKKDSLYRYPIGKGRFETVGIIIFGTLMSTVSLQIIINSITRLVSADTPPPDLSPITISLIATAILIKVILFLYCRSVPLPSVQILAQDHRNDILLNTVGLTMSLLSDKLQIPSLDPSGAIFVALVMFRSWTFTILEQGQLISGKVADINVYKLITYISMTHDPRIVYVETVRAYHCGEKIIVEVHVVLPPETSLQIAHDLGESLQEKLEDLKDIQRAFVHVDYNFTHPVEHNNSRNKGNKTDGDTLDDTISSNNNIINNRIIRNGDGDAV